MAASRLMTFAEKIIKPCNPTPLSLGRYNLCLIDQFLPPKYIPIAAFYPFPSKKPEQISNNLEKSLSRVLSPYYPFAGRLRDNTFVDCNDRGAKFMNVQYDCPMYEVINLFDTGPEYLPFPKDVKPWTRMQDEDDLLVIQLSHFNCGGLAISASLSHKVADGCTLCNLLSDWAAIARDQNAKIPSPQMIGSSIFPPSTDIHTNSVVDDIDNQSLGRKRLVFSNAKLNLLKAQVASETGVQNPTRIEVLSALIYKCAATAARANSSCFKPSVLAQMVNLRPIFDPPLPTRAIGNIFSMIPVATASEDEMTIARVVRELRKAKGKLKNEDYMKENKLVSFISNQPSMANEIELYISSSVCNYPFNNLDFGWGKPSRVTIPPIGRGNTFLLMDNQSGDGIEYMRFGGRGNVASIFLIITVHEANVGRRIVEKCQHSIHDKIHEETEMARIGVMIEHGRLRDDTFVDCNDRGAKFMNVRYDCPMSEVVNLPDTGPKYLPFSKDVKPWTRTQDEDGLLVIQLSHFNCGGLAISARLWHKVADGCTLCNLFSDWAAIARDHNAKIPSPQMIGSSIFPPSTDIHTDSVVDEIDNQSLCRKRLVFSNSKLKLLKAQVASETGVQNPTRLEVLSALIYKCASTAARANSSSFKPSVLVQIVNLRPIFDPPLPTRTIGNIFSMIPVATASEDEMTIARVVCELRKATEELKNEDHVKENKLVSLFSNQPSMANEIELYKSSSFCNYPLNNLDFGWGRPSRVIVVPPIGLGNIFFLMDNQSGDGIEAIVSLPENNVPEFENSKELLEFADLN
ncbi:hypothetical protein HAX54_041850 [Datura stramonium]|uniref:Acylsugar acyltransferase 3-like n=1 Tax=Datura stramonium TaxID=4076 RepID=A0ABS8SLC1_DATST|nr:hypothetical protein [Datura stramonium]